MAVVKTHTVTSFTLTDVKRGDVFQWLKESGCYPKDHVLVVNDVSQYPWLGFVDSRVSSATGNVEWLEREMKAGNLAFIGDVSKLKFAE